MSQFPKRILITGAHGMLGHSFRQVLAERFPQCEVAAFGHQDLDVRHRAEVLKWTDWIRDGWILHCAALVNVEGCARDPQLARETIVDGTQNVIDLAKAARAGLLYPQSFLIFDGSNEPIPEDQTPKPLALYGQLKLEAETKIREQIAQHLCIRMAGFFGGYQRDKNFVGKIIQQMAQKIAAGEKQISIGDRVWQPTWTDDLALNSLALIQAGKTGLFQMACHGTASFFELTQEIVKNLGWQNQIQVVPTSIEAVTGDELGKRPTRAELSCARLKAEGQDLQKSWRDTLKTYLNNPYFDPYRTGKKMTSPLFDKVSVPGVLDVKNRFVMSAMTRGFADADHCATDLMKKYYETRAKDGVGLILTEGVVIHPTGDGYNSVPHIATPKQADSWKPVIQAVHEYGTKIFCQLWHCGRISHPDYTGGVAPVSSTDVAAEGINRQNNKPYGKPEALTKAGIAQVHQSYLQAADNAIKAGFDGVQLHLGHGYLADSFFDARINTRTDEYGGSVENRCRFALELIEKTMARFKAHQVSVRISPSRDMGGIYNWPDMDEMLQYLLPQMWKLGVRILDISCARADYYQTSGAVIHKVRPFWPGVLMGGASLSIEQAEKEVRDQYLDLVTWGRTLIANPDLVEKARNHQPLTEFNVSMLKELK
jgi:dTDP-4-dehydrorhamnose reductase